MTYHQHVFIAARRYWTRLLRRHRGFVTAASREANINRTDCYKILRTLSLKPDDFRPRPIRPRRQKILRKRTDYGAWQHFLGSNRVIRKHVVKLSHGRT